MSISWPWPSPAFLTYFACCPLWGRRCPPTPESYWKKRALKQYTKFFSPQWHGTTCTCNRFPGIYLSVIYSMIHQLRLMGQSLIAPSSPMDKSSSPMTSQGKKKARSTPRKWEELWIWSDGCKILQASWLLKGRGCFRGWVGLEKHQESFWFTYIVTCWFSPVFLSIWFWGFFGFWICFQPSDVQGMEKPWQEDHYDVGISDQPTTERNANELRTQCGWGLGPAPGENQWSRVALAESQGGTWRCWKAMLEYEWRWFDNI